MRADSGGASGVDQATDTLLTDLPHAAISVILAALDLNSLCALSRTCSLLHGLASQPALWPHYKPEGCCLVAARLAMAGVLRLPPQVSSHHHRPCAPRQGVARLQQALPAASARSMPPRTLLSWLHYCGTLLMPLD